MLYLKIGWLSIFLLFFTGISTLYAQKGHIVIMDSLYVGTINDMHIEDNNVLSFRKFPNDKYTQFTVDQISEFSFKNRYYYRRKIIQDGMLQPFFLERIITSKKSVSLYRLNGKPAQYYIEKDSVILRLDDNTQLYEVFTNPDLENLIAKTSIKEQDLKYLFKTASEINLKPRTFTNVLVFTPHSGVGMVSHTFKSLVTDDMVSLNAWSPFLGFNIEAFVNFKRNVSVNFSPQLLTFKSKTFFTTRSSNGKVEADIFINYVARQLPLSGRYYFDAKPQKLRLYGELGYIHSTINIKRAVSHQAIISGNEVHLTSEAFLIPQKHSGFVIGIGAEKYLYSHRGIVFELKYSRLSESLNSSLEQVQFISGFKF